MEKLLLLSHVTAGCIVLITGFWNILNRKGGKYHRLVGKIYVTGMTWIFLSAWLIVTLIRFNFFLIVIAVLSFYSAYVGFRILKRKVSGTENWVDWVAASLTTLFGLGLVIYAIYLFWNTQGFNYLGGLSILFGAVTFWSGFSDLRYFLKPKMRDKMWWLYEHIGAMGGSYIAAITAFAVQNGNVFLPNSSFGWLFWILPAIVGSPIITYNIRKYKLKHNPIKPKVQV